MRAATPGREADFNEKAPKPEFRGLSAQPGLAPFDAGTWPAS
jgi:hypothetical protein